MQCMEAPVQFRTILQWDAKGFILYVVKQILYFFIVHSTHKHLAITQVTQQWGLASWAPFAPEEFEMHAAVERKQLH